MQPLPLIACIGDACIDYIATGTRRFPYWGYAEPFTSLHLHAGGQAVNCAVALQILGGASVYPVVSLGRDAGGSMIRDTLSKSGGDATLLSEAIVETEFPTTKVIVFVNTAESKDRAFLYTSPTSGDCTPTIQEMRERLPTLKRSLACHFTCVGQFEALTKPEVSQFMAELRGGAAGQRPLITADTSPVKQLKNKLWQGAISRFLRHVDYFLPADDEAAMMTGLSRDDHLGCTTRLKEMYGIRNVCIKIHDKGVFCLDEHNNKHLVEPFALVDVQDATGAGDAWCAGFIHAIVVRKLPQKDAFAFANAVANFCIRSVGATTGIPHGTQISELLTTIPRHDGLTKKPRVFISYSWDSDEHMEWVRSLAERMGRDGVEVTLDQTHLKPGDVLPRFMEEGIENNQYIIMICTPEFKRRYELGYGGVAAEVDRCTTEMYYSGKHDKFIPVLREGKWEHSAPPWLKGKMYINLSGSRYSEHEYEKLRLAVGR